MTRSAPKLTNTTFCYTTMKDLFAAINTGVNDRDPFVPSFQKDSVSMNQRSQPNRSSFSRWVMFIRALVSAAFLIAVLPGLLMRGCEKKRTINPNNRPPNAAELRAAREGQPYTIKKRTAWQGEENGENGKQRYFRAEQVTQWDPKKTAVIVCDVWDYHHSPSAVTRLGEIVPKMNALLRSARRAGSVIIHSPSDCMAFYEDHPARIRAFEAPKKDLPPGITSWNCRIEKEVGRLYPLDQSDGGDDSDPRSLEVWSQKLKELGRDPTMPWKSQNKALQIDKDLDYISDQGDEVWAILKDRQIEHVIMLGVHTNMCVLGRPFGLRQLVANGMDVVLVRDLTDCMYSPRAWPHVDHYSGNDLMITYIEETICPTITSDQIAFGSPVVFPGDRRAKKDLLPHEVPSLVDVFSKPRPIEWTIVNWSDIRDKWFGTELNGAGSEGEEARNTQIEPQLEPNPEASVEILLLRCSLRIPPEAFSGPVTLYHPRILRAWLNGTELERSKAATSSEHFEIVSKDTYGNDDPNLLVIELDVSGRSQIPIGDQTRQGPIVFAGQNVESLSQAWQQNSSPKPKDVNLPLPVKFALPPAVYYAIPR